MSMPAAGLSNANVYERLGIRAIVNASGPSSRLSGGIMRPEVAAAIADASQWCVDHRADPLRTQYQQGSCCQ